MKLRERKGVFICESEYFLSKHHKNLTVLFSSTIWEIFITDFGNKFPVRMKKVFFSKIYLFAKFFKIPCSNKLSVFAKLRKNRAGKNTLNLCTWGLDFWLQLSLPIWLYASLLIVLKFWFFIYKCKLHSSNYISPSIWLSFVNGNRWKQKEESTSTAAGEWFKKVDPRFKFIQLIFLLIVCTKATGCRDPSPIHKIALLLRGELKEQSLWR